VHFEFLGFRVFKNSIALFQNSVYFKIHRQKKGLAREEENVS
jgi:hypothetical protein